MINMKKLMAIIGLVLVLSGCTQQQEASGPARGTMDLSVSVRENIIERGESTSIDLRITNLFSQNLKNVLIKLEPLTSGITYIVTGPDSVEPEKTERWNIELTTSPGIGARTYNLYPVVCFDYTQEQIGYFRVTDGQPSATVDYSLSDTGPLIITMQGLKSINARNEDKIDVLVKFDFANNIAGGTNIYAETSDLKFTRGEFKLDTVNNILSLYTTEGGVANKLNKGSDNYCIVQTGGDNIGKALCYFTPDANYNARENFDFDIKVESISVSELESSFSAEVTYTYCIRSTSTVTSITVVEAK